jgi:hypothetical protein
MKKGNESVFDEAEKYLIAHENQIKKGKKSIKKSRLLVLRVNYKSQGHRIMLL